MNTRNLILSLHKHRKMIVGFCEKFEKIYIYGNGIVGEIAYRYLCEEKVNIAGVIISDGQEKKDFHGLPIVSFSELTICSRDGIILAMKRDSQEFVLNELKKRDLSENCLAPRFVGNEKKECGKYCLPGLKKTGKYFDGLAQL